MQISPSVGWKTLGKDLMREISDDNVGNGAAALAYYLTLSIFPAFIVMLAILAYLPIQNLEQAIMDFIRQGLPASAADLLSGVVGQVTSQKQGGLLSLGILGTLWAASNGFYAIIQQMNITYGVKEARSFIKARATAFLMMLLVGASLIGAFALVIFGGVLQDWLGNLLGFSAAIDTIFSILRWVFILAMMLLAFSVLYHFGPNVEHKFRLLSPGSVIGVVLIVAASLLFRLYVSNFGNYSATYGSIGAVIILMFWFYIAGFVLMLGSEINALYEAYAGEQPQKNRKLKEQPEARASKQQRLQPQPQS